MTVRVYDDYGGYHRNDDSPQCPKKFRSSPVPFQDLHPHRQEILLMSERGQDIEDIALAHGVSTLRLRAFLIHLKLKGLTE
jgi:hypothetical protein